MGSHPTNKFTSIKKLLAFRDTKAEIELKTNEDKLAFLISRIFGPLPMGIIIWLLTALTSGIGFWKALVVYPIIFFTTILIPLLITLFLHATKRVPDIEWKNIDDRKKYLLPLTIVALIILNVLTYFLTNWTIFHLGLLLSAILLTMSAIWVIFDFKISGHMAVATITFAYINLLFGLTFLWLFLLLIPIGWARWHLKLHTPKELTAGFALPIIYMLLALAIFGWPGVN